MLMKSVKSSNISKVGYEKNEKRLVIEFKGGGLYDYEQVPNNIYKAISQVDSIGSFLSKNVIRAGYRYNKLDPIAFANEQKKVNEKKSRLNKNAVVLVKNLLEAGGKTTLNKKELKYLEITDSMIKKWKEKGKKVMSKKKIIIKKKKVTKKKVVKKKQKGPYQGKGV